MLLRPMLSGVFIGSFFPVALRIGHDYQEDPQLTDELWHPAEAIDPFVQCLGDQCQVIPQ